MIPKVKVATEGAPELRCMRVPMFGNQKQKGICMTEKVYRGCQDEFQRSCKSQGFEMFTAMILRL